jgi:phage FluMu protein Com
VSEKIKPCKCGHSGELLGTSNGSWLGLTCPACNHSVEAFTLEGLVEAWQKSAEQESGKEVM